MHTLGSCLHFYFIAHFIGVSMDQPLLLFHLPFAEFATLLVVAARPCLIRDFRLLLLLALTVCWCCTLIGTDRLLVPEFKHRNSPSNGCIDVDLPFCNRIALLGLGVGT